MLRRLTIPCLAIAMPALTSLQPTTVAASEFASEHGYITCNWDTEDGLPTSHISAIAKTGDGYLWIGTPSGLTRFDGLRFKNFYPGNTPALPDSSISSLLTDHTGALWVGTREGALVRISGNNFSNVFTRGKLPRAPVTSLAEDASGTIWGTFDRNGAFRYVNGRTVLYSAENGLPSPMVWGATVDGEKNIWVISRWRLMRFTDGAWHEAPGLPTDFARISQIAPRRNGGLWIACARHMGPPAGDQGIRMYVYQNGKLTEDPLPVPCNQDSRRSLPRWLMEDQQGQVWLGTRGAGIYFRDGQKWQLFSEAPLLSQVQSACAFQDHDSTLWFGMDGAGLFQLRPKTVVSLEPRSDVQPSCFWSVCAASDGSILGGTDGNGIFRWKDGVLTHFRSTQGLVNEHVNTIIEDRKGRIWAGTMSGLFILERDHFKAVTGVDALQLPVFTLKEDQSGRIWVGTRNGLIEMSASATNVFGEAEGIPYGPINAVEEDRDGRIWVSIPPFRDRDGGAPPGQYGLFAQSGRRFEHFAAGKWAGESDIRALYADASGNLWIGTIGTGFYRLRDGKFTEYSWEDGIPHNRIQAMVADGAGNLWFCSELGVFGCPIAQLENHTRSPNARLNWWRVQRRDGLPNKMATGNGQPCAVRGPDGRIWFANANALTGFDPECVTATAPLAPPVVEEILVGGLPQTLGPDGGLRIRSESRRVEIHFTSPNTTTPNLPTFWTRLKGLESEWSSGGAARVASYHLPPGKYEFALAVTGPAGARLETAHPLQIEVVPTLLERRSVRISAGVLFIVAIALGVRRWEKSRSEKRLRQLEMQRALDQVRQRIARDIHDDLGSGLTEITLLSDNLRMDIQRPGSGEQTVERIATRARALTHEMDEVVWAINPHTDTLESLVTYLNDFAQERLALAGIRCRLNTATELPDVELPSDVRHSLYRAAKEALNNAIRHAAPSEVAITIEPHDGSLVFIIQDDGRGFDPEQQFKRGNGLRNMQHRLEEIGGSCAIQSRPGGGTSVCLTIPRVSHHAAPATIGHNGKL